MTETARFSRRPEDFTCAHCGREVEGTGYTNHCPRCLWSRHVDVSPGDRAATCGALMEPIGVLFEGGEHILVQRCTACAHQRRNRAAAGDSRRALGELFGRVVDWAPPPAPDAHPAPRPSRRRKRA